MLLRYADRNAMAFSRETRFPFLDHDLVDWAVSLPDALLVRDGWQKYVLRLAASGVVPRSVQWRADKVGYAAPLDAWLRGELREWARERVFDRCMVGLPGYERAALEQLWDEHQSHRADRSWELWRWISLGEWLALLRSGRWRSGVPAPAGSVSAAAR
jgi:asparagine synthase (glutamine-hydrolysing)